MISLQTNIDSLVAQQNLNTNSVFQSNTIQQLTSGYRINSSADDAAGLAVANADRDQISQITQGVANGNNGTAQLQIMDGGMSNISQILDRLQTLATEAASSTSTATSRSSLNQEFQTDITELNRQAQAIGLNTGGSFATTMDVYLGGGAGSTTAAAAADGQVQVNLSKSAVDAQALGLTGMQVVAGTQDISTSSTTHSVDQIVTNNANNTATAGTTVFYLSGPGFSDNQKVALSVNLAGVSDTNTLVTAINNAITSASNSTAPADQALKNANIMASVNTDVNGGQELAFSSSTSAFQVQAGDQMANALMGNFSGGSTGTAVATTVVGGATNALGTTPFNPTGVTVQIGGAGLASPVAITFGLSVTTLTAAINSLQTQVQNNTSLQAAGISVSGTPGSALTFTSATGQTFTVQATGDTGNVLGLGGLNTSSSAGSPAFYSTIQGSAPSTGNGLATVGFSLNGGPTGGGTAATIAGTAPTGITVGATVNTSALGTLTLSVNGTSVGVNFVNDANKGATETLANVVKYINNQVNAAMGWGSSVQTAAVTGSGATSTITLTDPYANSSSSLSVTTSATATALGLTGSNTGTGGIGNSITLNLAGGDATTAAYTSTTPASANVATSGVNAALNFSIDGQAVVAAFANDTNSVGTAAVFTGGAIGANANTGALQAQAAVVTGTALGGASTINTAALEAQAAVYTGAGVAGDSFAALGSGGGITINGQAVNLTDSPTTLEGVMNDINNNTPALSGAVTASIVTNNGIESLQLTSVATGSGAGIDVVDTADAEAAGLTVSGQIGDSTASGTAAQGLTVDINGTSQTVNWSSADAHAGSAESQANVAAFLNTTLNTLYSTIGQTYASFSGSGALTIASPTTGAATTVSITNNAAAQALGLTTAGQSGPSTGSGAAAQTLSITVPGANSGNPQVIDFSTDAHAGPGESQANIASFITANLTGATASFVNNALTITSTATGSTAAVSVGNGTAAQTLGLTTAGSANPTTINGKDETAAQVVSFLNTTAQKALGTATTANIFTLNANNTISIASQTKGATSNISLTAGSGSTATTNSIVTALGLTVASLASGTNASLTSLTNTLNQAFTANTTLQDAGLQATSNGTDLTIASTNQSNFRLGEYDTTGTSLGFGQPNMVNGAFTGLTSNVSKASMIDAGGTSALGNGSTSPYMMFTPLEFGSDKQAITITANNAAGVQQSPVTITLRNDSGIEAGATSGTTIDSAVSYINQQLQQSNNPTMQSIVAVKENVGGTEEINFLSSLPSFSVSVGSSANGNGMNSGTAKTFNSVANGTAASASIETLQGAQAAVTAVSNAVTQLGTAQAAVGIGENQVNYAVNLAQSQITNISSAESQIRDANVAQQAANMTKASVLQQATIAAMAQANQEPQAVLSLLKQ